MRAFTTIFAAAALTAFLAPGAHADEWNKRTYLTFSGPVQIPGATLPAGTYTFELAAPDTSRHVVRVSEKDTKKPVGLFMTIPNERLDPPADNLILFSERAAGSPQAVQVWFYPGQRTGEEFVYPKSQAVRIAKANKRPVLATADDSNRNASEADRMAAMRGASVGHVDETGKMTDEPKSTTTPQPTTTPQSTTTARSESTPSTTAAPANTVNGRNARSTTAKADTSVGTTGARANRRTELPRTASNLVALELISMLSLAGGFAVRRLRQS